MKINEILLKIEDCNHSYIVIIFNKLLIIKILMINNSVFNATIDYLNGLKKRYENYLLYS
jgi:hypothetical protein